MVKRPTVLFILMCMIMLVSTPTVFAQETKTAAEQSTEGEPDVLKDSANSIESTEDGHVSLDFREADIRNVLQILSLKSGVNIVTSPEVVGSVTIRLKDVPWEQALEVILDNYGYASERRGNIISVTTIDNLKRRRENAMILAEQEPVETKTFTMNFGRASEVIASIEKIRSNRGTVDFDERTNTLIVTDTFSKLNYIERVIKTLDATTPQVMIEAKIVETTLTDTENLGIEWITQVSVQGSRRPVTWPFTENTNTHFTAATFPSASGDDFTYGTLNFTQVQSIFEMLKTRSDTNILSNPKIVTLDNVPAQIVVGNQYPIPTYTYNEEQAALQVSGWEYMDIGIIFDVTPHVNSAGFITLDVEPKITEILDFVTVENTSLPRLSNESTTTSVMIKDGHTLIIAGLIKDKVTDTKKRMPFVSDIPIIGRAFQKKDFTNTKTDLLTFITPHIVTPEIELDQ